MEQPATQDLANGSEALKQLAASARGWHGIQLAVLGFIGFCGVFWGGGEGAAGPTGVQWLALALVVLSFLLALLAIFLVGRVAYPFHGSAAPAETTGGSSVASETRQLRAGIGITYLAVALLVTATLSAWWPATPAPDGAVEVVADTGEGWCGDLVTAPAGEVRLVTADGPIGIPLNRVRLLQPVTDC